MAAAVDEIALEDFDSERLEGREGLVAVCFYARWCGFCRLFMRHFREREAGAPIPFATADLSSLDDPRWDSLGIKTVPALVLFKDGAPVWRRDAVLGVGLFAKDIDRLLSAAKGRGG